MKTVWRYRVIERGQLREGSSDSRLISFEVDGLIRASFRAGDGCVVNVGDVEIYLDGDGRIVSLARGKNGPENGETSNYRPF